MKKIPLSKGQFAIVDDEDYEKLVQWKWHQSVSGYAIRNDSIINGIQPKVYVHRLILNVPNGFQGDHINRNKLDNRRKNLRICTPSQNQMNSKKRIDNASGLKGVTWKKRDNRWAAYIRVNKKLIHLGYFKDKNEAIWVRDQAALKYHSSFAFLNKELGE